MDRSIVYPSSIPLDVDILQPAQDVMIAIGYALQAAYGQNTVFFGLACQPTAPASMQVTVGPGGVIAPNVIETTPFGSLPADTTDPLVKMGINIATSAFTLTAPTTAGQSQNYLIQGAFSEADDTPATLTYFNSQNPNQPFSGPANSGTPQNTRRAQRANLEVKVGVPANAGTQVTPPVDTGWYGLYVITVAYGQTAITSASITTYPNAPFLSAFLSSHHGGGPGQAPKINLATEVQGILSAGNLPNAVGSSLSYAGNPNGHVAGTAANGGSATPPTMCWDTVDNEWWTCVTSGSATTAQWLSALNSHTVQVFTAAGTFVVPAGVTLVKVTVVGGGGSGGGTNPTSSSQISVAAGGNAGTVGIGYFSVTPGQSIHVTIADPGIWSTSGSGNGGSSSFGGFITAVGGQSPGANVPAGTAPLTQGPAFVSQRAAGGAINGFETGGSPSIAMNIANFLSGKGGDCFPYGSGGQGVGGSSSATGNNASGYGAGGSGGATGPSSPQQGGGNGGGGLCIIEY